MRPESPDLDRFVRAQEPVYAQALAELRRGAKRSHWMWFIFPQLEGLGHSATSERYGIQGESEARAYLAHPLLGARLRECADAVLAADGVSAAEMLGSPDDLKLRSCATLFAEVSPPDSVFARILRKYYGGEPDELTLGLLRTPGRPARN